MKTTSQQLCRRIGCGHPKLNHSWNRDARERIDKCLGIKIDYVRHGCGCWSFLE